MGYIFLFKFIFGIDIVNSLCLVLSLLLIIVIYLSFMVCFISFFNGMGINIIIRLVINIINFLFINNCSY